MEYEPVIGLEVHVQLQTESKMFCGCSTKFGAKPNTQTCPVCLGFPGVLPSANKKAIEYSLKVALALNCQISNYMKFDRKHYFYPDLPKNFQISQYDKPLAVDGFLDIVVDKTAKRIKIKRAHLEEDAGKLIHARDKSQVDFNRAGMPLLEIVTEPDINSPQEAYDYLSALKNVLLYLGVSDCNMEEGSLRCDANISIRPNGSPKLGTKTELKNMNTFKGVRLALEYEIDRQTGALGDGKEITQETRLWDADKGVTVTMRTKEEAHDYRYFPEPDLAPFTVEQAFIDGLRAALPELPHQRKDRLVKQFELSEYDASAITQDKKLADYFENCTKLYPNAKAIANWLMGDIMAELNKRVLGGIDELGFAEGSLIDMLKLIDAGTINGKMAKDVLRESIETRKGPLEIVKSRGLSQITDKKHIVEIIDEVLKANAKIVDDYKNGKTNAFMFLVGQVMKQTKGKANPQMVNELLSEKLK